jgi:hypothetical protein
MECNSLDILLSGSDKGVEKCFSSYLNILREI